MSVFEDIKDSTGGSAKSKEWYRSNLISKLSPPLDFKVGDVIYYAYNAATDNLPFYDQFPMTLVIDIDPINKQFSGGNLHYLRPTARLSIAKTWGSGSISYPMRCHHKYFMGRATNMMLVPPSDLVDFVPLPTEQFVRRIGGVYVEIPSSYIWSRL
jgi:hypothetical protein